MPKIVFRAEEMKPVLMIGTDAAETASQHEVKEVTERPITQEYVVAARILAIKKWQLTAGSSPRFMFIVQVKWTDGHVSYISRDHDDFFRYHSWVLDTFHAEAGHLGESRTIPDFPGLKYSQLCRIRTLWGIEKAFELQEVRITGIQSIGIFIGDFKGRDHYFRISKTSNYMSSKKTELSFLFISVKPH